MTAVLSRRFLPTLSLGFAATIAVAIAAGAGACSQAATPHLSGGGTGGGDTASGSGGGQGTGGHVNKADGHSAFNALEPAFYAACGSCHDTGGVADMPFLAGPDRYQSVSSWPNFIVADPSQSQLLTFPMNGTTHPGKNLDSPDLKNTLLPKIKAWLDIEAQALDMTKAPTDAGKLIPSFTPVIGFNAVYLDALGDSFTGMAITFTAAQLDDSTLELTDIEVHPTATLGVHLVHPLFVVIANDKADPDPVDSFSNVDEEFEPNQSGELGPGTAVLTNWVKDGRLNLAFETIEVIKPMGDGGTDGGSTSGCNALNSFNSNAKPDLQNNCFSCHGGGNPDANGAVDMSKLSSDPAAACAQIKNRINSMTPAQSQLFITTDPGGNAVHPFKFGGSTNQFNSFKSDLTQWIQAEN